MIESPVLALIFLFCANLVTGMSSAIARMGKFQAELICAESNRHSVLKYPVQFIFVKKNRDILSFALPMIKYIFIIGYATFAFSFLFSLMPERQTFLSLLFETCIILVLFLCTELIFHGLSQFRPKAFFKAAVPIVSALLFIFWPFACIFYRVLKRVFPAQETKEITSMRMRDKILEILQDPEFAPFLDSHDQKLILSLVSFKERNAREIMVPRIDMFSLPAESTIRQAAKSFLSEGYSRIPVYQESVDNIIGVVYYKDVLSHYVKCIEEEEMQQELNKPIIDLVKSIVYTPETKRISTLLQEFRNKQIHMAIVVDEYGGTEGIVTIEDILEELVGEIADEYDREEEALYTMLPTGGWIVDAKMGIIDIEEELGIKIPQSPEYDTIGGYIFHKAGTIPSKGWRLHQDEFDIEVLSSDERSIDKI
ncbi:MAG TPA: hemolysin family protein, partial [Rhabdochlamydiaceae bacterium]|nr:hemolysin family protein [Rhabdochlamydiaceae bacterium]